MSILPLRQPQQDHLESSRTALRRQVRGQPPDFTFAVLWADIAVQLHPPQEDTE
ncbi:hypothetical protein ACFRIC_41285 [Streptomyces sp. NPDC056738]|uniref:hypothetical protein n=1 Tax=Streptomyces sp. NPDC056738 TaxID=3345933 RepID=UPI0036B5BA15